MRTQKYLAFGGLAAFIFYIVALLVSTLMYPGYSHVSQYVSELGAIDAPSRAVMNYLGFIPIGISLFLFSLALLAFFKRHWLSTVGSILLMVYALSYVLDGLFSCEPGCNATEPIMSEMIHNMAAMAGMICLLVAFFLWAFRFKKSERFNSLWWYTLITGIAAVIAFLLFGMNLESPNLGIFQRLQDVVAWPWFIIVSLKLWRDWDKKSPEIAPEFS